MEYLIIMILALIIWVLPYLRVIGMRIQLVHRLKRICSLEYSFWDVFLPLRFRRGFVIDGKYRVHIFTSYRKSERIHLHPEEWRVEKRLMIVGSISRGTQTWYTPFRPYPDYIKDPDENTLFLLNPVPHSIYDGDKNKIFGLNPGDKVLGMEIVTMSTLTDKIIKNKKQAFIE